MHIQQKNFRAMTLDGSLFFSSLVFVDVFVLIPFFLNNLTGSPLLVGLAAAIRSIGFFLPQVFIAPWTTYAPRLDRFVFIVHFIARSMLILPVIGIFYDFSPLIITLLFFTGFTIFSFGEGIAQVPWMDVFGRTIDVSNRGKLFGYQQSIGGIGALIGGFIVQRLLTSHSLTFPVNFGWIFSIGIVLMFFSSLAFLFTTDPPKKKADTKTSSWLSVIQQLPTYLVKHQMFKSMLIVQVITSFNTLAFPFYILFIKGLDHIPPWLIGYIVISQVIGTIIGGFSLGWMSDNLGNRKTIIFTVLLNIMIPLLILSSSAVMQSSLAMALLLTGFILIGVATGGWLGFVNYIMDSTPSEIRPIYISISNLMAAPIALLPIFAGLLSYQIPFKFLFIIVAVIETIALTLALRLPEPRYQKESIST